MTNSSQHLDMYNLLTHEGDGVLSTHSVDVEGFPFGSVTPYCLDREFIPNILISSLAQHTKNIVANNKVSLLISSTSHKTNKQAEARLTYLGIAQKVEDSQDIKARYLSYFPGARDYFKTHDFSFYKILPVRLRYIGGFGKIYWIEKENLTVKNIFQAEDEQQIVLHMNQDHQHNLKDYARFYLKLSISDTDEVKMCGMDQFGLDLLINETRKRVDFKTELTQVNEARSVLVQMAKEAKV